MIVKGNPSAQRASEKWTWIGHPNTITPDYKKQKVELKGKADSIGGKSLELFKKCCTYSEVPSKNIHHVNSS